MAPNVFIAAATRSGSTHLANCLVRLGLRRASLHPITFGHPNEEHQIEFKAASILLPLGGFVFQSHVRAIGGNVELLKHFKVPTVVTYRNVFDSMFSFKEQTDRDWYDCEGDGWQNTTHCPFYLPYWGTMDDTTKFEWIAYNVVPWYFSFFLSWRYADWSVLMVNYDDFHLNQVAGLRKVIEHIGMSSVSDEQLKIVTAIKDGKFSRGESGHGGVNVPPRVQYIVWDMSRGWGTDAEVIQEELLRCARPV